MITGEHAVVYGHRAIVASIDQRVHVRFSERLDGQIKIMSEIASPYTGTIKGIDHTGPYRFVGACLSYFEDVLPSGLEINIRSQIDPTMGLGSSAAVTIACLGGLSKLTETDPAETHSRALAIVRKLQGRGSGADLAASLHGGMIAYQMPNTSSSDPRASICALPAPPELSLRYSGYKTPTGEVLALLAARREANEAVFDALYARMAISADEAIDRAKKSDWASFGARLTDYQDLLVELGVSDDTLDRIVEQAMQDPNVLGAKISGSGLGDCVVAIGAVPEDFVVAPQSKEGLRFDD